MPLSSAAGRRGNANIAYVATLENMVYAIDVDQRTVCWQTEALGVSRKKPGRESCRAAMADGACNQNFNYESSSRVAPTRAPETGVRVGIASTPVIDLAKSVMYVVTRVRDGSDARGRYFVQVLDTRTGQLVAKVEAIADTLNGRDDCNGKPFHPSLSTQRRGSVARKQQALRRIFRQRRRGIDGRLSRACAGLRCFESRQSRQSHAFLLRNTESEHFPTAVRSPLAAAACGWRVRGLASDGTSAYFTTGKRRLRVRQWHLCRSKDSRSNPVLATGPTASSSSRWMMSGDRVQPTARFALRSHTMMYRRRCRPTYPNSVATRYSAARERSDADFGSGGVLLLGNRLIGGGKDGRLYVIDTATMSRVQDFQAFVHMYDPGSAAKDLSVPDAMDNGPHIHGSPVAWDARPNTPWIYVYAWAEKDRLKRFRFDPTLGKFEAADAVDAMPTTPFQSAHGDIGTQQLRRTAMPGGMLSISSNGPAGGIVWATMQEPYKFCTKLDPGDGQGARVLVDQPCRSGHRIPGCNVMGGYVSGPPLRVFSGGRPRVSWRQAAEASLG